MASQRDITAQGQVKQPNIKQGVREAPENVSDSSDPLKWKTTSGKSGSVKSMGITVKISQSDKEHHTAEPG